MTVSSEAVSPAEMLRHSPIPALRRLHVQETNTEIVISGRVASYYQKQLAQETLMPTADGRRIVNRVEVASRER